ncbi:DUF2735 domain-containing protein [Ancylobacter sp. 6x-1]|uniref:DUF2735 domain-containing protein n=1 Tax=Ancylobacter crimeensis TaxID=2579147 RepID=A0ABT0DBV8_9HYPH|nr:DUF2735 domain-containing protein [Ancylobacter crimeensis]MCK0197445.1 DUF2735 domain-containing protein [Ancylobacter crimeensis]
MPTPTIAPEGAQIFQFPKGGRAGLTGARAKAPQPFEIPSLQIAAALDGSWYHAEAIQDAEHAAEHERKN